MVYRKRVNEMKRRELRKKIVSLSYQWIQIEAVWSVEAVVGSVEAAGSVEAVVMTVTPSSRLIHDLLKETMSTFWSVMKMSRCG